MTNKDTQDTAVRLDKWLWAARFFKTRSLASKAVSGGHVHLNGKRVKPSRLVQGGEQLRIKRGTEEYIVIILALSARRGPAKVAQTLYEETEESQAQREQAREQRRLVKASASRPEGRPDKRDRRKIRKFLRKE
ncbi:RNA-binding S4 domain-containing protein [Candidatus Electrothrix sp.]|uniref:RNA-binding S4 domain-containing protein n=1 Tax=Candidatus Electrothrix sp. TaxID=2170559 RepID=UPI0040567306